jgi:methyltransferase (TIGR00027 family)
MARTNNDTWDITESVGATALGVAAARAAATEERPPLIDDPFARLFLDAAGEGIWNLWGGALPEEIVEADPDVSARMRGMVDYMACRTVFFDQFFTDAAAAGVRQVVILASGLDARTWRLPWPAGTRVFELDQPKVLEFKTATLRSAGATPRAELVEVAVDLRQDWPKALQESGFDPSAASVWSAEGLLMFLPAQAQDELFERIHALSAPGSRVAVEALSADMLAPDFLQRQREQMQRFRDLAAATMRDADIPEFEDLWYLEPRADVAEWLTARGWDVAVQTAAELLARHDRPVPDEDTVPRSLFVSGRLRVRDQRSSQA